MNEIEDVLRSLGVTRVYKGYHRLIYAVQLAVENEDRLEAVTKEIYEEVGQRYGCKWTAVERNIRTAAQRAWLVNKARLGDMAGYSLDGPPSSAQFIEIIANYLLRERAARKGG